MDQNEMKMADGMAALWIHLEFLWIPMRSEFVRLNAI